jgi:hypothetical protein
MQRKSNVSARTISLACFIKNGGHYLKAETLGVELNRPHAAIVRRATERKANKKQRLLCDCDDIIFNDL